MQTQSLLYGLVGFFIGGLLVSVAATTFEKNNEPTRQETTMSSSMHMMTQGLQNKTGDEFDAAFIAEMIEHHQGAIDMARLSAANAKHEEIKQLSEEIIAAQEKEIDQMRQWQKDWGYSASSDSHGGPMH